MTPSYPAPWHKQSFDHFLLTRLPELLAERLPLAGYSVQPESARTCRVTVELRTNSHSLRVEYPHLPQPDEQGVFEIDGQPYIVVPIASREELDQAEVRCAGEQLYDAIAARLGRAPAEVTWDETVARAFLPLDAWFSAFLSETTQRLDDTNWHSLQTHLRRVLIPNRTRVIAPGQQGRVDPFEVPEGPNIGRVFTVALGAEIRAGRIVILDSRPEAALGPNAACIPLIEHDDANRLLMGDNMMRQGLVPPEAEPALVQTGYEPPEAGPDLWCGRNLLTAFIAWGEGAAGAVVEDGLILSESCARRLDYPYPAEPGDKLANRHGTKGVVSQVLPDAQMPHLADGTPVEMIFSFTGLHTRMNFGQVREAVLGRIARAEGKPVIVPPFRAPGADEIRARLAANGLPESGMERLRAGQDGPELPYPSTVGWVYWYRLAHLARPKMQATGGELDGEQRLVEMPGQVGQVFGEQELAVLRQAGALRNAHEAVTTRAMRYDDPARPSSYFRALAERLDAAGIAAEIQDGKLAFCFAEPDEAHVLRLPRQLSHPWLPEQHIRLVGEPPSEASSEVRRAFDALKGAASRLERWLQVQLPARPIQSEDPAAFGVTETRQSVYLDTLYAQVDNHLSTYFDALLSPDSLRFFERQRHSGRAVIAPGIGLRLDQVGLPESIARALFGSAAPEEIAQSWVIIQRAPAVLPTSLLAFHPVIVPDPAIRLHPQACALLNADFDGDQVAVHLPLSPEAQREAGERLSVAAHLARTPALVEAIRPPHEGIWGLALLSLQPEGRQQIASILGSAEDRIGVPWMQTDLVTVLAEVLKQRGPEETLRVANALAHLGYTAASASGASLSPFAQSQVALPPEPPGESRQEWELYCEACAEAILSGRDYADPNLGPQLLSAAVRARSRRFLPLLVGPRGPVTDATGRAVIIRRNLVQGRTADELYATVAGAREGLAKLAFESEEIVQQSSSIGGAITVLARARRSRRPGLVFARAAASGEVDPLTDEESRVLVGE